MRSPNDCKCLEVWWTKKVLGVYGAPVRNFGAPGMAYGDMRLNNSADATAGSHFHPRSGPGMDYGGSSAAVAISGQMMHHTLFDIDAPIHCVSSGCLDAASPDYFSAVGGRIFWKWRQWWHLSLTRWTFHHLIWCWPMHGSIAVSLQVLLPEILVTTLIWCYAILPLLCYHCSSNTRLCHGSPLGEYSSLESFTL